MHTKSDLEALSIEQLNEIAHSLNISTKADTPKLNIIYSIIEAELAQGTPAVPEEKTAKKRGRKPKAEKEAEEKTEAEAVAPEQEKATSKRKSSKKAEKEATKQPEEQKPAEQAKEEAAAVEAPRSVDASPRLRRKPRPLHSKLRSWLCSPKRTTRLLPTLNSLNRQPLPRPQKRP